MDEQASPPLDAPITSRGDFRAAVKRALTQAAAAGARQLWLTDPTFTDWPLSEPDVIEQFTRWAEPQRRLVLLAGSFEDLSRRHARWAEWRRHWAHVVECRSNPEVEIDKVPTVLLAANTVCVRLLDREHYRGSTSTAAAALVRARETVDAVLQRSAETFAVTTLGL